GRSCRSCPGWPPRLRFFFDLERGGLTISLEGGLEEVVEFFLAAASSARSWATSARSCSTNCVSATHPWQTGASMRKCYELKPRPAAPFWSFSVNRYQKYTEVSLLAKMWQNARRDFRLAPSPVNMILQ